MGFSWSNSGWIELNKATTQAIMKINLLSLAHKMPDWVETAFKEYNQRLPKHLSLNPVHITPANRAKNQSVDQIKQAEAEAISRHLKPRQIHIAFDERGKNIDTAYVADQLAFWQMQGDDVNLIIGGADGLHQDIIEQSHQRWSLSSLTFPHQLVKVIIVEQIYRGYSLLNNHPYHRE